MRISLLAACLLFARASFSAELLDNHRRPTGVSVSSSFSIHARQKTTNLADRLAAGRDVDERHIPAFLPAVKLPGGCRYDLVVLIKHKNWPGEDKITTIRQFDPYFDTLAEDPRGEKTLDGLVSYQWIDHSPGDGSNRHWRVLETKDAFVGIFYDVIRKDRAADPETCHPSPDFGEEILASMGPVAPK